MMKDSLVRISADIPVKDLIKLEEIAEILGGSRCDALIHLIRLGAMIIETVHNNKGSKIFIQFADGYSGVEITNSV